ncbi:hypothetical protein LTR36_003991 [Oleoguttula mirabilis]|uniref:Inositol polyphosphate-related phosphatase domain-containing protein n=1 Tax=Oleoguttula mirabilis TaxID=1507867 RepID=A0AAV9JH76_9PEZI|nr:hypothetical protein LTR36_003991 [Oleoguttula mirabilis]
MADLNCYITTFNCGRSLINVDYFAANLFHGLKTELPPDFIVLCLQEIAPIGQSFVGGSLLTPYFARFMQAVADATARQFGKDSRYNTVVTRNVGMTGIMVFARHELAGKIRSTETAGVGVGVWEMGNKGAVGVRLGLGLGEGGEETSLSFVAAHLAPMEGAWRKRNADWRSICEGLVFEKVTDVGHRRAVREASGEGEREPLLSATDGAMNSSSTLGSMFDPPSHLFFAGDLNYRTSDQPPQPEDSQRWPQPVEVASDPLHYSRFLPKDQLSREHKNGDTLHHLAEAPVDFPPTYKYSSAAQKHVAHSTKSEQRTLADGRVVDTTYLKPGDNEEVWLWAQHRTPSWCDRILFLNDARPTVHSYTALPIQPTSDHRPVALSCTVSRKPADVSIQSPFKIRSDWRARRAAARRYEMLVGIAAYLALTWEGEALLAGTIAGIIGGYLVLRALLGI